MSTYNGTPGEDDFYADAGIGNITLNMSESGSAPMTAMDINDSETADPVTGITVSPDSGNSLKAGSSVVLTLATAQPVVVSGMPILTLNNGAVATYSGTDVSGNPQFTYTIAGGDDIDDLKVTGLSLNGGSITAGRTSFAAHQDYETGPISVALVTADLNGDGKLDLITANYHADTVSVLLGSGDGTFEAKTDYSFGSDPSLFSVAAADVNGDGRLDLIATNDDVVSVLLGKGDGTFQTETDYAVVAPSWSVLATDVNEDGKADMITVSPSGKVSVLLGNGDGTFQAKTDYVTGSSAAAIVAGDFNGDGKPDLITAGSSVVSLLLGDGHGAFQNTQIDNAPGSDAFSLAAADLNGDGKLDVIVSDLSRNIVSVLLGSGDGTFLAKKDYATGPVPHSVVVTDVNGDGKLDLVVANDGPLFDGDKAISILLGNGDGTFQTKMDYAVEPDAVLGAMSVTAADINDDGKPDIIVGNDGSASVFTVSVLLNTSIPPSIFDASSIASAPGADTGITIDTVVPTLAFSATVQVGAQVTLSGSVSDASNGVQSVDVYNGATLLGHADVDQNADVWTLTTNVPNPLTDIRAIATDLAGNASNPAELTNISSIAFTRADAAAMFLASKLAADATIDGSNFDTVTLTVVGNNVDLANDTFTNWTATDNVMIIGFSSNANTLRAGPVDTTIMGGSAGDLLTGGAGNDTLIGGGGSDTAAFVLARSAYDVRTVGDATHVIDAIGDDGSDTLTSIEHLQFADGTFALNGAQQNHTSNVSGSRFDDVLFQHDGDGQVQFAKMVDGNFQSWGIDVAGFGSAGNDWHAMASGDVNRGPTGGAEVFFEQQSTGNIVYASLDTGATTWGTVTTALSPAWHLAAVADLNGDASVDVVVQDLGDAQHPGSGLILYGDMAGGTFQAWRTVNASLTPDWKAVGAGDLNGDGFADVVIQNQASGATIYADMAHGAFSGFGVVSLGLTADWQVKAVADVNGDGFADVVFQNLKGDAATNVNPGTTLYADVSSGTVHWGVVTAAVTADFVVAGAADVDNDGHAEVLFQQASSGATYYAHADGAGAGVPTWGIVSATIPQEWHVA